MSAGHGHRPGMSAQLSSLQTRCNFHPQITRTESAKIPAGQFRALNGSSRTVSDYWCRVQKETASGRFACVSIPFTTVDSLGCPKTQPNLSTGPCPGSSKRIRACRLLASQNRRWSHSATSWSFSSFAALTLEIADFPAPVRGSHWPFLYSTNKFLIFPGTPWASPHYPPARVQFPKLPKWIFLSKLAHGYLSMVSLQVHLTLTLFSSSQSRNYWIMWRTVFPTSTQSAAYWVCVMESLIQCTLLSIPHSLLIFPAKSHSKTWCYFLLCTWRNQRWREGGCPGKVTLQSRAQNNTRLASVPYKLHQHCVTQQDSERARVFT